MRSIVAAFFVLMLPAAAIAVQGSENSSDAQDQSDDRAPAASPEVSEPGTAPAPVPGDLRQAPEPTPAPPSSDAAPQPDAEPGTAAAVPAGTLVLGQLRQPLSSERSRPGDRFTIELLDPLVAPGGQVVAPRGALAEGVVRNPKAKAEGGSAPMQLTITGLRREDAEPLPLALEVAQTPVSRPSPVGRSLLGAAAGAAAGAGTGLAIDSDSGAVVGGSLVVGAGVGALAGYLWSKLTSRRVDIPTGSVMTLRLTEPLRAPPAEAKAARRPVESGGEVRTSEEPPPPPPPAVVPEEQPR